MNDETFDEATALAQIDAAADDSIGASETEIPSPPPAEPNSPPVVTPSPVPPGDGVTQGEDAPTQDDPEPEQTDDPPVGDAPLPDDNKAPDETPAPVETPPVDAAAFEDEKAAVESAISSKYYPHFEQADTRYQASQAKLDALYEEIKDEPLTGAMKRQLDQLERETQSLLEERQKIARAFNHESTLATQSVLEKHIIAAIPGLAPHKETLRSVLIKAANAQGGFSQELLTDLLGDPSTFVTIVAAMAAKNGAAVDLTKSKTDAVREATQREINRRNQGRIATGRTPAKSLTSGAKPSNSIAQMTQDEAALIAKADRIEAEEM